MKYRALTIGVCLTLCGCAPSSCSPTSKVSNSLIDINKTSLEVKSRFENISKETQKEVPNLPQIYNDAENGIKEAEQIRTMSESALQEIPNIKDKNIPLRDVFLWGAIVVAILGILFFLIFTPMGRGLSTLVGNILSKFASLLPTPSTKAGILLAKADDPNDPNFTHRDLTTALREIDPILEQAYIKEKNKRKNGGTRWISKKSEKPSVPPAQSEASSGPSGQE